MKTNRINISSNSHWRDIAGYSRTVKIVNHIFVSGTTAIDSICNLVGVGDLFSQSIQCIFNTQTALVKVNADLSDIVRLRILVVNIDDWEIMNKIYS